MMTRWWTLSLLLIASTRMDAADGTAAAPQVADRAVAYLKGAQDPAGGWSSQKTPGVTGVVLTGMLRTGRVTRDDESVRRGLKYVESLVNSKDGHIAGAGAKVQLHNYVTSINVMALTAAGRDDYKAVIGNAVEFLKRLQWDEGENVAQSNDFYGGAGYDSKSRPDLSNTQFFLDALQAAGVPKDDPAVKRCLIFVSRCQNLKSEHNDQPWAGKVNDGSFIYSAAGGGATRNDSPESNMTGYGSMTYAGIKSMIYCGVSKDDPRMVKALEWIAKNYTLDKNPGMPPGSDGRGLYYYYHTLAKTLSAAGIDTVTDGSGVKHDWRKELVAALAKRQRADGSFVNATDRWMEGDANLVTGYALMALSYCEKKD